MRRGSRGSQLRYVNQTYDSRRDRGAPLDTFVKDARHASSSRCPPGCDIPDALVRLLATTSQDVTLAPLHASVTADTVKDQGELVDLILRQWLGSSTVSAHNWLKAASVTADLSVPQRLKAFFTLCPSDLGGRRLLFIRRFDRLFRQMSGELLAVMRILSRACCSSR